MTPQKKTLEVDSFLIFCILFQLTFFLEYNFVNSVFEPASGNPANIIQCLKHVDLKDVARPVAFLAKMTGHGPLVVQLLGKGLLNPNSMRRLLDNSSPREVKLDVLMIVSDVARMHKDFYEHIKGADILEHLKGFLTHEDPNIRAK
ncbi:putative non-specific serine/threonine protein kinase [Helianthus annuus]|uniref:non-specific serine/threonine protein kinase n=1 Tax=Helianthus annuus TaxID=4232 RepID=A0A251RZY8_HELAN|nr:putative non-specific serine/threonine protein kinase [Helianthus annuus]KAJ0931189.1 putative non-specific serine/threonine protein kinase [Helianthus annuus]